VTAREPREAGTQVRADAAREGATESRWVIGPLSRQVEAQLTRLRHTPDVRHVAVMPDVHLGGDACVGSVVATSRLLYPSIVGGDLGCGMAALRFTADPAMLDRARAAAILRGLARRVPAAAHRRESAVAMSDDLELAALSHPRLEACKRKLGRLQLGTLGGGNHFLELDADEQGALWMTLHSGSRGIGQAILAHHLRAATPRGSGLPALEAESAAGVAYLSDLQWGLRYAEENRRRMAAAAAEIIEEVMGGARVASSYFGCHHNFVRREAHSLPTGGDPGGGRQVELWVHRKGAISASLGEPGIIPGSMGTASFHVEGRGHPAALGSSSHGAGRCLSRGQARQEISVRAFEQEMRAVWFDHRSADRLREEAPSAYKDIGAVIRAQRELTRIVRPLRPLLSYKGA
jgi:tRNA-splicing ligase RtcB (3'-phosphate/5'-hydroxy nucleic acid ligase)